jgi:hypothetical protein
MSDKVAWLVDCGTKKIGTTSSKDRSKLLRESEYKVLADETIRHEEDDSL